MLSSMSEQQHRAIVVGTDGSSTATEAVRAAGELARARAAQLHVVTAYHHDTSWSQRGEAKSLPEAQQWVASPGAGASDIALETAEAVVGKGIKIQVHARPGDPVRALIEVAEEVGADLIVVGNKGMTGLAGTLRPTVPNRISHHAPCDVLIVNTSRAA
jgi:nucleotide-binding universal stress UspA family protein